MTRREECPDRPDVAGTRADAETLREEIAALLAPMGLRLFEAKTTIVHLQEGFDFLG